MLFTLAVLSACAAVIVPTEAHYASDPVEKASRGEIGGLDALSLLRADRATAALEAIRAGSPAESRVQDLTLYPTQMSAQVVVPADGSERNVGVDVALKAHFDDPRDASSDYGVTFRRFDMTVPEAMARAVLARLHRPESDLLYATASISSSDSSYTWSLFLQHGRIRDRQWTADADGSNLKRPGE